MRFIENALYHEDLGTVTGLPLEWDALRGRSFLISGATGMIGSTLIDVLMKLNREKNLDIRVFALGRSREKAEGRFAPYLTDERFRFLQCSINEKEDLDRVLDDALTGTGSGGYDYVFHAASNTHPVAYATDPIGTITTNIIGLNNLLDYASGHGCRRFLFASSNEIYGENRGDAELFDERYCGYIDCNTMRAGYPESKRAGEALCQAYIAQKKMDVVILRFTRSFGPALLKSDTKALSQFLKKGLAGEDIVLKSEGTQFYSYTYVCDAISGLFTCLLKGECGEAYNIADVSCDITLRDLAKLIADFSGRQVVFEIPDAVEQAGYSKATKARLDSTKLQKLGWKAQFDIGTGIRHTLEILKETEKGAEPAPERHIAGLQ